MKSRQQVCVLGDLLRPETAGAERIDRVVRWLEGSLRPILADLKVDLTELSPAGGSPFRQNQFYALNRMEPTEASWDVLLSGGEVAPPALSYLASYLTRQEFVLGIHLTNLLKELLTSLGVPYINLRPLDFQFCADLIFWAEWNRETLGVTLCSAALQLADLAARGRAHAARQGGVAAPAERVLICNDAADPMLYEWGIPAGYEPYQAELLALVADSPLRIASPELPESERHLRFLVRRFPDAELGYGEIGPAMVAPDIGFVACLSPATALHAELVGKDTACLSLAETPVLAALADDPMQALLAAESLFSSVFWARLFDREPPPGLVPAAAPSLFRAGWTAVLLEPGANADQPATNQNEPAGPGASLRRDK